MNEKICLTVLFSMTEDDSELVIAERDDGKLFWKRFPSGLYHPGDGVLVEDTYPVSILPPEGQAAVYEKLKSMPPELLESLRTGWDSEEG